MEEEMVSKSYNYTHTHTYIYIYTHIVIYVYAHMFVCITYVYVCKHVYIGEASQVVLMVKNPPANDFPYTFFLL